jgi:D-alanine-D-alanine ligase-like ATP-grasp enzyme
MESAYTGTGYLGSALAMEKGLSKNIFIYYGIPTHEELFERERMTGLLFLCG